MIRTYRDEDLHELIDVWYQASLLAHPFLDEAFFALERKRIEEIYMPLAETWVYVNDANVVGFISLIENIEGPFPDQSNSCRNQWSK